MFEVWGLRQVLDGCLAFWELVDRADSLPDALESCIFNNDVYNTFRLVYYDSVQYYGVLAVPPSPKIFSTMHIEHFKHARCFVPGLHASHIYNSSGIVP